MDSVLTRTRARKCDICSEYVTSASIKSSEEIRPGSTIFICYPCLDNEEGWPEDVPEALLEVYIDNGKWTCWEANSYYLT